MTDKPNVRFADRLHNWAGSNWQVIFKTHDGRDYCRETLLGTVTKDAIEAWTIRKCKEHGKHVGGAVIERW